MMAVHTTMHIHGEKVPFADQTSGVTGYLPVFDDYEKALAFASGNPDMLVSIQPAKG